MDLEFSEAMRRVLGTIPPRRTASCSQVARALGDVRASRAVADWIREHPRVPGATRVVRADGAPLLRPPDRAHAERRDAIPMTAALPQTRYLSRLREEQRRLGSKVSETDEPGPPRMIGGVDVCYEGDRAFAAAAVCDGETLEVVEVRYARVRIDFPYIPTYLGYRELPPMEAALHRLAKQPDVLLVDGHGRLHPAGSGIACMAGVRLGLPTIGVAKHPLVGRPRPSANREGGAVPVEFDGEVRGLAWTPPRATRPVFVSIGHRVSLQTALSIVIRSTIGRGPKPLIVADTEARKIKEERKWEKGSWHDSRRRESAGGS